MSRLSNIDALFLAAETREMPAHIAGLQIYQLPRGKGSAWLHALLDELRQCRPGPPFNQRLAGGMGMPRLEVDKQFEINYHVRHTMLPSPGDDPHLHAELARLHANLLDRDRPLWEFHLIEGLSGRRFAFYIKIHHALCDGATFSKWMAQSTSPSPNGPVQPIWQRARREEGPTPRPWLDAIQAPASTFARARDMSLGLARYSQRLIRRRLIEGDRRLALPFSGPHTALNAPLTASRSLACTSFPLETLKAMGRPYSATLNDVVLALCDAALRRYLGEQDRQPDKPLVAAVPVNLRRAGEQSEGNFVTSLQVKLGSGDESPADRLRSVSASVKATRELCEDIPASATQVVSFGTALMGGLGSALHLDGIMPPPLNLIISNVPGPRETRYFRGAKLLEVYPISGIAPMTALNVTVYSYNGTLFFGLVSGRRALPHLYDLKLCFEEVYEEFYQSLIVEASSVSA
jgi:diacylglycerol O-acyltransferase